MNKHRVMVQSGMQRVVAIALSVLLAGCATTVPYVGQGPHPQLTRGAPVPPVDFLGNVLSLPLKLLLWSWKFNLHTISSATEEKLVGYLDARDVAAFEDARFRLNQYAPFDDLKRLTKNRHVAWPYRLLLGFPATLIFEVILPGRLFPWGDYFNPWTNTVHLYSDHPAISLHEAGHVYDFSKRRFKGTYAMLYLVPFVDLYHEWKATDYAIDYMIEVKDRPTEISAYKILWPAYGSYAGSYLFPPFGTITGILLGHAAGRTEAHTRQKHYEQETAFPAATQPPPSIPSSEPSTPEPITP